MLRNYLTIAIRNLSRFKVYAIINIAGLAIGMASCALILLYVQHELSYDRFHTKGDRMYRVLRETRDDNGNATFDQGISGPFAPTIKKDFQEIEEAVRLSSLFSTWVKYNEKSYHHSFGNICFTDPNFLDVFDFTLIKGNRETALDEPFSMVMSEETAKQYFGNNDPIGKVISLESQTRPGDYTVTGVIQIPKNSSVQFDMIFSINTPTPNTWWQDQMIEWQPMGSIRPCAALIVLRKGVDAKSFENKLPAFMEQYMGKEIREKNTYHLQPLNRLHLYTNLDYGIIEAWAGFNVYGNIHTIYLFSAIAASIMLIACVNFMNLSTARSTSRAKEVGLRKVSGAYRFQLIQQFLGEAMLLSLIAFVLALGIVELTLPKFSAFVGKDLMPERNIYHLVAIPGLVALIGLFAGSYPGFFLSGFEPVTVLKGHLKTGAKGARLRKGLVVFQFAMSILLIIGTVMIYRQLNYIQNRALGFDKEQMIRMPILRADRIRKTDESTFLVHRYQTVKQAFLAHPNVLSATAYRLTIGGQGGVARTVKLENGDTYEMVFQESDETFLDTFGIDLIEGRNFSDTRFEPNGTQFDLLINEAAVKQLGWSQPLGKQLRFGALFGGTVIGVIKNYHSKSLHQALKPLIIVNKSRLLDHITVKVQSKNMPETLAFLEKTWKEFLPDRPFEFQFVDESLNQLYAEDQKAGQMVGTFAGLAIFVACLGLFGLAAYTAEQRTKEIGVRKVLGASTRSIVLLLSKEFAKLILIANLIAWPVAYVAINTYLQSFAYRVDLAWWVFALGGITTLFIAWATVGYQAIRAALSNPIEALRYE
ncbi:MAG: putative ABC transport system permease protein [Candidatus Latescibacterota bacterium]|jgi:putative ABC transport system permease protein